MLNFEDSLEKKDVLAEFKLEVSCKESYEITEPEPEGLLTSPEMTRGLRTGWRGPAAGSARSGRLT